MVRDIHDECGVPVIMAGTVKLNELLSDTDLFFGQTIAFDSIADIAQMVVGYESTKQDGWGTRRLGWVGPIEPRIDYRGIYGNTLQALSYGPRYFLGIKGKF